MLGWIVNIVVSFVGAFLAAPLGGMVVALLLSPFMGGFTSLAAAGGPVMHVKPAGTMIVTRAGQRSCRSTKAIEAVTRADVPLMISRSPSSSPGGGLLIFFGLQYVLWHGL